MDCRASIFPFSFVVLHVLVLLLNQVLLILYRDKDGVLLDTNSPPVMDIAECLVVPPPPFFRLVALFGLVTV